MPVNKTQEFLYFQNKAKHYDTIRNMKSSVKDKLEQKYLKNLSFLNKEKQEKSEQKRKNRLIPLIKEIQIKQENEKMISRLLKMYKSERTQVKVQGNYSRFNKQQRKFRSTNPYKVELNRTIQIDNNGMKQRISKTKPRIGSSLEWSRHFGKTVDLKKNMSRYLLESNKSKGSLHISVVDSYVPKYYGAFLGQLQGEKNDEATLKEIQITRQGLLMLPDIKSKVSQQTHTVTHNQKKRKLIFDSSRSSLHSFSEKGQSTINPEKNSSNYKKQSSRDNKKLLSFKFSDHESNSEKIKISMKNSVQKNETYNDKKDIQREERPAQTLVLALESAAQIESNPSENKNEPEQL